MELQATFQRGEVLRKGRYEIEGLLRHAAEKEFGRAECRGIRARVWG